MGLRHDEELAETEAAAEAAAIVEANFCKVGVIGAIQTLLAAVVLLDGNKHNVDMAS